MKELFDIIWKTEEIPEECSLGYIIKLPKKGDLSNSQNLRGIQLLLLPSKVLARIILERIKTAIDANLRYEQAGFRFGRSCIDQIATLRIIIEQSIPLHQLRRFQEGLRHGRQKHSLEGTKTLRTTPSR